MKVDGYLIKNLPVYIRDIIPAQSLFQSYVDSFDKEECVGRHTFLELTNLMTMHGEMKAGLSTYYIQLRDSSNVFCAMMRSVQNIPLLTRNENQLKSEADKFIAEWKTLEQFMMWDYPNNHLSLDSGDISHF